MRIPLPLPSPLPRDRQAYSARRGGRTTPYVRGQATEQLHHSRAGASSALRQCSGPRTGLGPIVRIWSLCFLRWRNVAKNVNSQRSVSTACVCFSTTFSCFSFLPADLIMLLCPHLLNSLICCINTYMLQPTTALWPSYLPDPHSLVCSGELPPTWGWNLEASSFPGVIPQLRWVLHTHVPHHRPRPCFSVIAPALVPLTNCVAKTDAWHFNASPGPGLTPVSDREKERGLVTTLQDKMVWEVCRGLCKRLWEKATVPRIQPISPPTHMDCRGRGEGQSRKLENHQVKRKWK